MRDRFSGWYRPTPQEFAVLWEKGLIALDASVLLSPYRLSPTARTRLLDLIDDLKERLWIPHRCAYEYQRSRLDVIQQQEERYGELEKRIQKARSVLLANQPRHPVIDRQVFEDTVRGAMRSVQKYLDSCQEKHPPVFGSDEDDDRVRASLDTSLNGRVGPPLTVDEAWQRRATDRYSSSMPPGYLDAHKEGIDKFGDLIVWYELLLEVKERSTECGEAIPVFFVTEDRKDDWWRKRSGEQLGPRPELVEEMNENGGAPFWMYRLDAFMTHAAEHLGWAPEPELIAEVADASEGSDESSMDAETEVKDDDLPAEGSVGAQASEQDSS